MIGILMGSGQHYFFANLSLFYCEKQYINNLKKQNVISVQMLHHSNL